MSSSGVDVAVGGDELLWRASREGDGEAFGVLFDRHRDRVYRHACRLVSSRHDAEDVLAATFLELWRRRADVRLVGGSVLPWLLMTATNLGRNTVRGTRRYRSFLAGLPRCEDASDTADIALNDHGVGIDPVLRTGLRELRAVDAQLVVLVVLEGYAVTDAAGQVGLTVSAARSRLHRARTRLRDALGSDEREEHPANQRPENQGEPS